MNGDQYGAVDNAKWSTDRRDRHICLIYRLQFWKEIIIAICFRKLFMDYRQERHPSFYYSYNERRQLQTHNVYAAASGQLNINLFAC